MLLDISPETRLVINLLGGVGGLIALLLSIILFSKYKKKRSKVIQNLAIAFLLFVISGLSALPIAFFPGDYAINKLSYLIAKIFYTLAVWYFINFIEAIFNPAEGREKQYRIFKYGVLIASLILVVIYHPWEIVLHLESGRTVTNILPPTLIVIHSFLMAVPFLWLLILAINIAKKTDDLKEKWAIKFIAYSGLFMACFFIFNGINEWIQVPNPMTIPAWISAILALNLFYIGVARPKLIFKNI